MSDTDDILHNLDETLKAEDDSIFGYNQSDHDADYNARENPSYRASYKEENYQNLRAGNQGHYNEESTLVRKRMKTAREASTGLEDILMEMPSRTLGRRRGHFVEGMMTTRSTYSRRFGTHRSHRRMMSVKQDHDIDHQLVEEIFKEISDNDKEVSNDEIRELPVNMEIKRRIRKQAFSNQEVNKSKKLGYFWLWRSNMSMKWRHLKADTRNVFGSAKLWSYHLKQVEGNFGSGVHSYFTFLRGLFLLSIPSFILNFAFISIPQLLVNQPRSNPDIHFTGEELITGANWFTETIMYYGFYVNGIIETIPGSPYKMSIAYLLATAGYFLLCLLWLIKLTATSFRRSYIVAREDDTNFISKVFCAWDFGITSKNTAELQHKIISTELKEILAEKHRHKQNRSFSKKVKFFFYRLLSWSLYLAITAGCLALIYFLNKALLSDLKTWVTMPLILRQLSLSLIVSTINLLIPILINLITHYENYKYPRHELYIAVFRNFVLKLGMLGVICGFWTDDVLKTNHVNQTPDSCWETEFGQEIYRLVIIDFLFSIVFATFCAEFLRNMLTKWFPNLQQAEFSIVNNVMDLIYGQTLCWIGVYFSPLLALIIIFKYFIMFYVKKVSVMQNCRPSNKRWRAAQSRTLFNMLLLLSFLLCTAFLCVVVFLEVPSPNCGPFRGMNRSYDAITAEFAFLYNQDSSQWFAVLMGVITSVWFVYGVVTLLTVAVVLVRSRAIGYRKSTKTLQDQIALEGRDKALLLEWLRNVSGDNGPGGSGAMGNGVGNRTSLVADKHVVPLLNRHRDSINSKASTTQNSRRNSTFDDFQSSANVLTHVDPHHLDISHLKISNAPSNNMRRREHKDPLLHKALVNQSKQPTSLLMEHDVSVHKNNSFKSERTSAPQSRRSSYTSSVVSYVEDMEMDILPKSPETNASQSVPTLSLAGNGDNRYPEPDYDITPTTDDIMPTTYDIPPATYDITPPATPGYYDEGTF